MNAYSSNPAYTIVGELRTYRVAYLDRLWPRAAENDGTRDKDQAPMSYQTATHVDPAQKNVQGYHSEWAHEGSNIAVRTSCTRVGKLFQKTILTLSG